MTYKVFGGTLRLTQSINHHLRVEQKFRHRREEGREGKEAKLNDISVITVWGPL